VPARAPFALIQTLKDIPLAANQLTELNIGMYTEAVIMVIEDINCTVVAFKLAWPIQLNWCRNETAINEWALRAHRAPSQ
jgi:hypothetical protein